MKAFLIFFWIGMAIGMLWSISVAAHALFDDEYLKAIAWGGAYWFFGREAKATRDELKARQDANNGN